MGADNLSQLSTWVDAAYWVHPDLNIHTYGSTSSGYGLVHCKSSKKMNIKCSTESKVGVVSDYLSYNIWICLFM